MISSTEEQLSIGIISDTHGFFRPKIAELFKGMDYIIHAGDIGSPDVLQTLTDIAPVLSVLGNTDAPFMFPNIPDTDIFEAPHLKAYVLHILDCINIDPKAEGFNIIISGHTHRANIERINNILYINPGSAGHQRSNLPASIALLHTLGPNLLPEIIELN